MTEATALKRPGLAVLLVAAWLAGCAPTPMVMRYDASGEVNRGQTWPALESGEVPRYRYVGQLTGEQNFRPAEGSKQPSLRKLFNLIVGLGDAEERPTVLQRPQSGWSDGRGRVYVTDVSRKAVFVFDEAGGQLHVWDRVSRTEPWRTPIAITGGRGDEILVTDADHGEVFRLGPDGSLRSRFGKDVLVRPTGIARDPATGRIYVADTYAHHVAVFDDDGRRVATIGERGEEPGKFNFPLHLAFARGTLYVTDSMNARIQTFAAEGSYRASFGQRGLYVGNLVRPKGVAVDDEGNVYVIESMHDTLLVFDSRGRFLLAIGGTGREVGKFFLPAGVWVDGNNRVYVADMFNGRIVVVQFLGGG